MKLNNLNKKFKKAFTLVELIIVIAVIAILAVFIVPNFSNVLGDANVTNVKSDASNIKNIVMAYVNETGAVPVINTSTTAANRITIDPTGAKLQPGISLLTFQIEAAKKPADLYVIDMDLLTKDQVNIDDKITTVKAKLPSIPGTSAIIDVNTVENGGTNGTIDLNKTIKNTSVVYCIDKDLNVYPVYNKLVKKGITNIPSSTAPSSWAVLSPSTTLTDALTGKEVKENHPIFKQSYIEGVTVNIGLAVDDSNYN